MKLRKHLDDIDDRPYKLISKIEEVTNLVTKFVNYALLYESDMEKCPCIDRRMVTFPALREILLWFLTTLKRASWFLLRYQKHEGLKLFGWALEHYAHIPIGLVLHNALKSTRKCINEIPNIKLGPLITIRIRRSKLFIFYKKIKAFEKHVAS